MSRQAWEAMYVDGEVGRREGATHPGKRCKKV